MNKNQGIERRTKLVLHPTLTSKDLASALMDKTEYQACMRENTTVEILGRKTGFSEKMYRLLLKVIKPEAIEKGDVKFYPRMTFEWGHARGKILSQYGLSDLRYFGTRNKIVGLEIGSNVTLDNSDEEQLHRVTRVVRAIKQRFSHIHMKVDDCEVTVACSPEIMKALQGAMGE